MATIKEYLDYAELAQAAYGFLNIGTPNQVELNEGNAEFTKLQAEKFSERYTVLAVSSPNSSGFSATLFIDETTGKKILSIRGTEKTDGSDYYADWELTLSKHPEQYESLVSFFEELKSSGDISTADNLVVTGHSLGGALTQMITATYPSYVDEAYTYNSPGAKNLSIPELEIKDGKYYTREFFTLDEAGNIVYSYTEITKTLYDAYLSFDANKNSIGSKVVNLEAKDGPSVITDLGVDIGGNMEVFINADGNYLYNHSSKTLTQTLAFYNTLISVDSTLSIAEITQFLEEVDGRNIIVKDQLGLHQELLSRMADILEADKASNVFDIGKNIVDTGAKYSINFLTNKSISYLKSKDPSNLYALLNSNPFAIQGNLPAYANINPADYSDMYMSDRADYMYYILDKDARYGDGTGKDSYRAYDSYGVHLDGKTENQVIFGTDNYNNDIQMNGGEGNDRIYGLAGNDTLVGNGGNDTLDGGVGMDTLMGGADFDTYYAGNTDIIYDSDGKGEIYFDNINLSGVKTIVSDSDGSMYEDNNYTYFFENPNGIGSLTIIEGTNRGGFSGKYITVNNFNASSQDGYLGITLAKKHVDIYVGDATALEGGVLEFTVGIDNTLEKDLVLNVDSYFDDTLGASAEDITMPTAKTITIKAGETSATYEVQTNEDEDVEDTEKFIFAVTSIEPYTGNDMNTHLIVNAGEGTIDDNDDEQVLHVNITSVDAQEGDLDDNNQLTFIIGTSRVLEDGESVTLNLNINDISTDSSDYGFLSQDTITLNSSNQYQTITLDIFGDEEKEASETLSLNATVVESTGVSDVQIISDTATIYDDDAGATPYDDFLVLSDEDDSMDALAGDDTVYGKGGNDYIDGNSGNDLIFGGNGSDVLFGGSGDDVIVAGDGDDVLSGDEGADYLVGGSGADYYLADNGDTILDSDGNGVVLFNNTDLSGVKKKLKDSDVYEDENYTYTQSGGLVVTSKSSAESLTIVDWSQDALGITLQESDEITVSVGDATAFEAEEMMRATVTLGRALEEGEELVVDLGHWEDTYSENGYRTVNVPAHSGREAYSSYNSYTKTYVTHEAIPPRAAYSYTVPTYEVSGEKFVSVGSVKFEAGDQEKTYTYTWKDDDSVGVHTYPKPNPLTLTAKANEENSVYANNIEIVPIKAGTLTIKDDDIREDNRYDPLVLDTNKDGFISTTSLDESNTYFDLTGDGLRERVGWIEGEDALLVYDKNENAQIDGIDEVFGSVNESGFDELRRIADSNRDNKIDKRDELFNSLQVWHDVNQDARVQEGELRSLNDEGITSIDLNAVETNIDVNGNTLSEASKYTDVEGNKELVADIQLNTDLQDTKVDVNDIPNYSVDETTRELPQFAGSGLVYDSFILYNIDEEFKAIAKAYASDIQKVQDSFEAYIEQWSGYTNYVNELGERYSVENFTMAQSDKQAWITERFLAKDFLTNTIENYYETNLNNSIVPTSAAINNEKANTSYTTLLNKAQSTFTILAFYEDEFSDTHYDIDTDKFIIDDNEAFNAKLKEYFNSTTVTTDEKLYLGKVMYMQGSGLNFDVDAVMDSIDNNITKTLLKDMFLNREVILGSEEDDTLQTGDIKNKILLGKGDDILQSGNNHDVFYFRVGDGSDVIQDAGGLDRLVFDEGITRDDVIIKLDRNSDLTIALKEDGKTYEELSDKVLMLGWMNSSNRVETIEFGDGETLSFSEILEQFEATDNAENIQLSSGNDIINAGGGNDVISAQMGNDTIIGGKGDDRLDGGTGNDIYIYAKGDGKDIIIDGGGHDILQFSEGVSHDDLLAKFVGSDLLIAIKEDGKTFDKLSDVITLKNYKSSSNTIESIFLDGYHIVDIQKLLNSPTENDDNLELGDTDDTIDLLAGDDTVYAGEGDDTLFGGEGFDTLRGEAGKDTLEGGQGNDTLEGGLGDDTYIFNRGDGKDTIYDDYSYGHKDNQKDNAGNDTLIFGDGINADDIIVNYLGSDLIISLKEDGVAYEELSDVITIKNYTNVNNKIENILLNDGTSVEITEITNGTGGNDTLSFIDSTEDLVITGLGGLDFIHTGSGSDFVDGGTGSDTIYTGDKADNLIGGAGNDLLVGGAGDDTYVYNRGDGSDIIIDDNRPEFENFGTKVIKLDNLLQRMQRSETEHLDAGNDTLAFGEGITREDISYKISGNDLIISVVDSGSITIKNHLNSKNMIENIVLFDGEVIDLFGATDGDDSLVFGDDGVTIDALAGDDVVSTGSGNDTITGSLGDDLLKGGAGDDTYVFKRGDGQDTINDIAGVDTLKFIQGITEDDILVRLIGKDLHVGLKEDGVGFADLSDKIIILNHTNSDNKLENILFDNGSIDVSTIDLGTDGDDTFVFGDADTIVDAHGGDDDVTTGTGNDTITGGTGNDTLRGWAGDDTYIFGRGDGVDTIEDIYGNDSLEFAGDITGDDVIVKLIGRDLHVALKEDGVEFADLSDKVIIVNHTNTNDKLETIKFSNGTSVKVSDINFATAQDDVFIFGNVNTTIDAKEGDDIISTSAGNDVLTGGAGNDILNTGAGQDALIGSQGNDTLNGGREDDTYVFNRGDGVDTIHDFYHGYDVNGGIIEFDRDPQTGSLIVKVTGDNLIGSLRSMERRFSDFTKDVTENEDKLSNDLSSTDIMIKLVGDDLVIAFLDDGKFENWSNNITFRKYVADNGHLEFGNGVVNGDIDIDLVNNDLVVQKGLDEKVVFHHDSNAGLNDTIVFGEGIGQDDIVYKFSGNDLTLALKDGTTPFEELSDKIIIKEYVNSNMKIENILFSEGTAFDFDGLPVATEGDDHLVFVNNDVVVDALGGNDIVTTGSGDDIITGGSGGDTLHGGAGSDTYVFSRGYGKDSIVDSAGNDTIKFGDDILESDLLFKQDGYNLTIALREDGKTYEKLNDKVVITDWFKTKNNIETIQFSDDSTMTFTEIATMLLDSAPDTLMSNHGAQMIGGKGNDTYVYRKDDFTVIIDDQYYNKEIEINAGNDTLKFEDINRSQTTMGVKGDDLIIKIEAGHDTYTELKDYVVIRDWRNDNRGIEFIVFGDNEVLSIDKTAVYPELVFEEDWITGRYYIYGSEDNIVEGSDASEAIESGAGDDTINAFGGSDSINAGLGNDTIDGGLGNDTYIFNIGDGTDTISDNGGIDAVKFGSNITRDDLDTQRVDNDLIIALNEDDKVILKDWFNEETIENRIELMVLENEGTIAIADFIITPTEGNDDLEYGDEKNNINALAGDDIIHIGGGNDVLFGGDGDDLLYGEEGDDFISGDAGVDTLYGADGNDTYLFGRGDGKDTIIEDDFRNWGNTGNDTLKFKDGVSATDLILLQDGDDLVVGIKEDGVAFADLSDRVTLKKWSTYDDVNSRDYSRAYYTVENFAFSDGSTWNMSDIISNIGSDEREDIHGFNQGDTIEGKKGDDNLYGHLGDDTYVFNRGDGKDTIYDYGRKGDDYSYYDAGNDTLKFGDGIAEDDLIILKDNDDVLVYIKEGDIPISELSDKITIKDWFVSNNRIENMTLFDGTEIDYVKYLAIDPTENDDNLIYGTGDDYVDALAGDDVVVALGGNNIIDGNSGDDNIKTEDGEDLLIGGEGNDTLDAGAGSDTLEGGDGDDTYIFNRGDGQDTISDSNGNDSLKFGMDITTDDLLLFQDGSDLIVALKEDGIAPTELSDKITISNWLNVNNRLENITFIDGTTLDVAAMMSMTGIDEDETISGTELDDVINAKSGNDILIGGTGNDTLDGGAGNDTYIFNIGDGQDTISDRSGNEVLKFGTGISKGDLVIKQDGDNLILALKEDGVAFADLSDKITIINWVNIDSRVETIEFSDGTLMNASDIIEHIPSDSNDVIVVPQELAVNIHLKDGDDTIEAGYLNDTIYGDSGNDELYGGEGDDTLIGGIGNDYLEGGEGNDTYIFNIGDGYDEIFDTSGIDTLSFGAGIQLSDLLVEIDGSDVYIGIKEENKDFFELTNVLLIDNFLLDENRIENFSFADDRTYTIQEMYEYFYNMVEEQAIYGSNGDDRLLGSSANDIIYGLGGSDFIFGEEGNDILNGGTGLEDRLFGWFGNDTYVYNKGDGYDRIYEDGYDIDIIEFGNTIITIDDIIVESDEYSITLGIKDGDKSMSALDDKIVISGGRYANNTVEMIKLSDGSTYNIADYFGIQLKSGSNPTPIVLDLNGNGITSTSLETSNAYFDYDGDGNREHTAWAEKGDALLVADLNNDGIINDGTEHFGDYTKLPDGSTAANGYEALAQYDTNGDNILNNKDSAFGNLLLWMDTNQNGKSEDGELTNILLSNVTAIHLNDESGVTFEQYKENGNIILNETNYITKDGNGIMRDVGFAYDPFDTITNNDTLSKQQYGNTLSGEYGDDIYLYSLGDGEITIDDNGDGNDTVIFASDISKEQLLVKWDKNNGDLIVGIKESIYDFDTITEVANKIIIKDFFQESGSIENFKFADGSVINKAELYNILLNTKEEKALTARTLEENSSLEGGTFNDILYGTDTDEELQGLDGNDFLKGLSGDDLLSGGEGSDVLNGGTGDDTLYGDNGDDIYIYEKGDGRDIITDTFGNDSIFFGEGILKGDMIFTDSGNDMIISFEYDSELPTQNRDSIVIVNYYLNGFALEMVEFFNGEVYTFTELLNTAPIVTEEETFVTLQEVREQRGNVEATDEDGDILTYTVTTAAKHGALSIDETGTWSYSVDGYYMGEDSAVITVDDGNGGSVTQTLNFNSMVSEPTIDTVAFNLLEDNISTNNLNVNNPVGGTLTYEIITSSQNGVFALDENGEYSYNPSQDYNGSDSVIVKVTNEYGLSTTSTLTFDIEAVNDAPILTQTPAPIILNAGASANGTLKASDVDGDTLHYTVTSEPEYGTLSINNQGVWDYSAERYYAGQSSATVTIDDGHGGSTTATLDFTNLMTPDWHYSYSGETMTINDNDGIDVLMMNNTSMSELTFLKEGDNLRIDVKDKNDVFLSDYFTSPTKGVESVQTLEGSINLSKEKIGTSRSFWSLGWGSDKADLISGNDSSNTLYGELGDDVLFGNSAKDTLYGDAGDDLLIGGDGNDNLYGGSNNDTLYGDNGDDYLNGEAGDDKLFGGDGNDTLKGEEGNDLMDGGRGTNTLSGGVGDDIYLFNKGSNNTTINEDISGFSLFGKYFGENGGEDTLRFGEGITKEDISFLMKGNNLLLQYGDNELITINYQKSEGNKIEKFELNDGSYLSNTDVEHIVQQITAYSQDNGLYISNNTQIQNNQALMNIVAAGWHQ